MEPIKTEGSSKTTEPAKTTEQVKEKLAQRARKSNKRTKSPVALEQEEEEKAAEQEDQEPSFSQVRLLKADEIECRVSMVRENGLTLLLYKDARVDQKILDETFGPCGWQRSHQVLDGNLYCTVSVWDGEKGQWISKQDVGTVSYTEKEKGQASDSFKRACFNWGIGRELYTAPSFLWIPAEKAGIIQKDGKYASREKFKVLHIAYNSRREISELVIANGKGQIVYAKKDKGQPEQAGKLEHLGKPENTREALSIEQRKALEKELERTGVSMETVLSRYQLSSLEEMPPEVYARALDGLKRTKTKAA